MVRKSFSFMMKRDLDVFKCLYNAGFSVCGDASIFTFRSANVKHNDRDVYFSTFLCLLFRHKYDVSAGCVCVMSVSMMSSVDAPQHNQTQGCS